MDENQQNQNEHVYSTVAKNPYLLPEPQKKSRIPWIVGIVVAVLVSFGLGIGFCLWVLRDAPAPAPVETAPGTQMADTAAHITDADMAETHGKPQDPPEDVTPEDATEPPVDPSVTGLPEVSVQTAPEPETPPTPDDPVDPESTHISDTPVEPETPPKPDDPIDPETTACNHQYGAWLVTAPATCTVAGMQMQSCQLCGEVRKEPIEPTGHTETILPGITPSCSRPGLTDGKRCEVCGDTLVEPEQLPQLDHTEEEVPAVEPTCTDHGYTAGIICTECGVMVVGQDIVPAKGHTPGADATCTEPQNCTVCGELLSSENGHIPGLPATCTTAQTCSVCQIELAPALGHTEVIDDGVAANCTETGLTEGVHCSVCKAVLVAQEVVEAKGHTEVIDEAIAANCTEAGLTEGKHCSVCSAVLVAQNIVAAKGHIPGKDATCTEPQNCTVCGEFMNAASGHIPGLPATCTTAQTCSVCQIELAPALGHAEVIDKAVAANCTEAGLTEGKHCSVCSAVLVAQEVVPAKGHTPGEWIIDEEPALGIEGSRHTTCTVCGAAVEETIEMLYSQGLAYTSNGDGTCYVSGLGTCTDTEIVIPATYNGMSVVNINEYAFIDCSNLTSVIIPDSVTSIGQAAFCRCGFSSVVIGNSVVNIDASAFAQCDNLISVNIPDSVTHLGRQAFASCPTLTSVVIGSGVVDIGQQTFWFNKNMTSFTVSEQNSFYCSVDGVLFNKDITELIQVPCLKSGNYVIPQSVTTICSSSFNNCSELTSITLPDGLISIGDGAFQNCVSLVAISLPESVTSIGESAFKHCTKLSSVNLPNGITEISRAMFWQCFSLTSISIPESVTSIGDSAFVYTGLTSITIPKNVTSIGKWPFDMTDLTEILVEEGNPAYYSTGNCLIEIQSKTVIAGCDTSIIPADGSVVRIQDYAFKDCSFTSFVIPESITEIGANAFHQCSALSSIVIPDNVTILGKDAFWNCRSLTEIILGNGLTSINEGTFQNCVKLTTIIMSRNVKTIGRGAFNGCQNLSVIYFTGTEAEWNAITIGSDNANLINATVHFNYVP